MSDEIQETIEDVVADIRAQNQGLPQDGYALSPLAGDLLSFADRIEAAANRQFREVAKMIPHEEVTVAEIQQPLQPATDCHGFGNAAEMREAITKCVDMITEFSNAEIVTNPLDVIIDIDGILKSALSAPPRNCDVLSDAQEALAAIHEDRCYVNNPIDERRLTVNWLFAEAKRIYKEGVE